MNNNKKVLKGVLCESGNWIQLALKRLVPLEGSEEVGTVGGSEKVGTVGGSEKVGTVGGSEKVGTVGGSE
jgi:hypothetical protein